MGAEEYLPDRRGIAALRRASADCRGCPLYRDATQTVFGKGRVSSPMMLVGEQPGDREDREGEPFVGPAGGLLDKVLDEAGIAREEVYLTNAVKHFKWRPQGKRRLHDTPKAGEVKACRPWLEAEIEAIGPRAVVALGATAARSLFGTGVKVEKDRGRLLESPLAPLAAVTIHPSALLRVRDSAERNHGIAAMAEDLGRVAAAL